MPSSPTRCLILACGNTLRGDDGIGPWLAEWAEQRFGDESGLRVLTSQQWAPDLAEDIADTQAVLFVDCSIDSPPGSLRLRDVKPSTVTQGLGTHHLGASELLALSRDLYDSLPRTAILLTIGAGSMEFGDTFSNAVRSATPDACKLIEETVQRLITE